MKKLVVLYLLICMSILSMVAEVSNNVKFMGISMESPFSEFVSSLAKKCELVEASSSYAVFKGNFAGLTECSIMVASTDGTLLTMVLSQEYNSWQQMKSDFLTIAKAYEGKYGTPTQKTLDFDAGYYDGCGEEIKAIKNDYCNYGVTSNRSYLIGNPKKGERMDEYTLTVKAIAANMDVTIGELAEKAGIDPSHLYDVSSGRVRMTAEDILKLSAVSGLSPKNIDVGARG